MMRFPRADVHELLSCDLLHQAIKGTFKDHLVEWVEDYLKIIYGTSRAEAILDEIDRRCVKFRAYQNISNISQYRTCATLSWPTKIQTRSKLQTMDWK